MAEKLHDRNYEWGSYRGPIKIKDMTDLHVVNIVHMLNARVKETKEILDSEYDDSDLGSGSRSADNVWLDRNIKLRDLFKAEMTYRNLGDEMLKGAPYPFLDDDGNERLWDPINKIFKIKTPSIRYITSEE